VLARATRRLIKMLRRPLESAQYTSWLFGSRLRARWPARLDGQGGLRLRQFRRRVVLRLDADRATRPPRWTTRTELATAIFEYIEAFYNPIRRHSAPGYLSPIDYEPLHIATKNTA